MAEIDFDAEGLLEGLEGEPRGARLALLTDLADDGVSLEELREAVTAGRLALLPVERALAGEGPRYTPAEVAEKAGVERKTLQRMLAALGVPIPDDDAKVLADADVAAARRIKAFRDLGIPEEGMLQVARTIGMTMATIAQANRELILRTFVDEDDNEHELALRLAAAARGALPLVAPMLGYGLQIHLLEQVRRDVIGAAEIAAGNLGGAVERSVFFADLVGFTKLGEQRDAEELGQIASRLEEMAIGVAAPPVRLVKLIGDAAMFVSPEPVPMVEAALALVQAADDEGEQFPQLRAGVAHGPVLAQGGDFYGSPVNLASRITGVARPGSVLASEEATEAAGEAFGYSFAGEHRLKGISAPARLFRVREVTDSPLR